MKDDLAGCFLFLKESEKLKDTLRYAFTSSGKRESSAEHSWRLCLFVMLFARHFPTLNVEKCLKLAVIHDLAEAICGDTPAILKEDETLKAKRENEAFKNIVAPLAPQYQNDFLALWNEYRQGETPESYYVKTLDKLETLVQHNQGKNPPDFQYAFNLQYGKELTEKNDFFHSLRAVIDKETKERIRKMSVV